MQLNAEYSGSAEEQAGNETFSSRRTLRSLRLISGNRRNTQSNNMTSERKEKLIRWFCSAGSVIERFNFEFVGRFEAK